MRKIKLTKQAVESAQPESKDIILWDTELRGFGLKITPSGKRIYILYYRTSSGTQRKPTLGAHGELTCDEARKLAKSWLADVARGEDPSQSRKDSRKAPTIRELASRYLLEHAAVRKKASSVREDQRLLEKRILPALGGFKVRDVTRKDVQALHQSLQSTPYEGNRTLALVSKMMNLAELWDLRPQGSNPTKHVQKFKELSRERYLNGDELARLGDALRQAEESKLAPAAAVAAIRLLIYTGARVSEIRTARWDEFDEQGSCLRLADSKTGRKEISLPEPALEVLRGIERQAGNPYIITGPRPEEPLGNIYKPWYIIRALAGLEGLRLHDLRHTFASYAVSSNMSLRMLGDLLGHTQPATTQRYAHLHTDPKRSAANIIASTLEAAMDQPSRKAG